MPDAPRILVGAPASGGGKTTFACGLARALVRRGLRVAACKCGPDYIDPMFHEHVVGAPSRNLDLFFASESFVRGLVAEGARGRDVTVIEGAMGYYDGIGVSDEASAWHVARATQTPAVLVVDGRGRALRRRRADDGHGRHVVLRVVCPRAGDERAQPLCKRHGKRQVQPELVPHPRPGGADPLHAAPLPGDGAVWVLVFRRARRRVVYGRGQDAGLLRRRQRL